MAAAVIGLRYVLDDSSLPLIVQLVAEIGVGAIAYVAAAFVLCRATVKDLLQLLRGMVKKRRGGDGDGEAPAAPAAP